MLGQVPIRAQRPYAQFGNRRIVICAAKRAQGDEHVGPGIIREHTNALFLDSAPPRQPAYCEIEAGRLLRRIKGGRIKGLYRHLVSSSWVVGVDFEQTMRLVIEIMAAIRNNVIFVLARLERDAVGGLLEQIDRRSRIKAEHFRLHGCGKPSIDFIEGEQDIDGLCLNLRNHLVQASQVAAEKLARKRKKFAQQIKAFEYPLIIGKQRILSFEPDLTKTLRGRRTDDGIAELVEPAEEDPFAMSKELLVQRNGISFRTDEVKRQIGRSAAGKQHFGLLERVEVGRLVLRTRRRAVRESEPHAGHDLAANRQAEGL